jgi:3',5'-cyclic-AMP phosphodiesterase
MFAPRRSPFPSVLAAVLGWGGALCTAACVQSTPFGSDPEATDQTRSNLEALSARGPAPMPFKFVAIGDNHDEYDDLARSVEIINARDDIEFVLVLGDMTDRGLLHEYEWTYEVFSRLDIPFLTVIGNHDALSDGTAIYQKLYGPLDYTFEYGGFEFVMFNSNTLEFPGTAPNRQWLTARTSGSAAPRGVVWATHYDVTAPDDLPGNGTADFYAELLRTGKVALVAHGHIEDYELSEFEGVRVLQAGTYQVLRTHTIVTVDRDRIDFERCRFESCEPVKPRPFAQPTAGGK